MRRPARPNTDNESAAFERRKGGMFEDIWDEQTEGGRRVTCRVSDVRHIERHTAKPLLPDPIPFEVEIATAALER
jgi:hypothetical protein